MLFCCLSPLAAAERTVSLKPVSDAEAGPTPLLLLVSIRKQRIRVFNDSGEVSTSRISSGRPGFDTPTGVFSILEKNVQHTSNIYDAEMPFMQRLTWSGIALHSGVVPGYRASHGCIRLPNSFARSLFGLTRTGARVVVSNDETEPVRFDHPNLFKPLPAENQAATGPLKAGIMQVALNDKGNDAGALPNLPGVSPALAEALQGYLFQSARPRSRREASAMLADRITRLQDTLKTAEAKQPALAEKAAQVVKDTAEAAQKLETGRKAVDPVRASVKAAEAKLAQALKAFETFMQRAGERSAEANSADREADLEDAISDAAIDADRARAGAAVKEMAFAEVQATLAKPTSERQAAVDALAKNQDLIKTTKAELDDAKKDQSRRDKPLSVFISLKSQRIYVRQGFEPVADAPVTLSDPTVAPAGTHVLTAMRYGRDGNSFEWKLVSAQMPGGPSELQRKKRDGISVVSSGGGARAVAAILNSVKIPQPVIDVITERARVGASVIISDRELSKSENGAGTEFVVLTR